jgi:hypothetical protein
MRKFKKGDVPLISPAIQEGWTYYCSGCPDFCELKTRLETEPPVICVKRIAKSRWKRGESNG